MMTALYEEDFVLWTEKTAELLKRKEFDRVDWEGPTIRKKLSPEWPMRSVMWTKKMCTIW